MHSEAPPDLLRWKVGDVSICVIPEVDVELPATMFFPAATIAEIADIGWLYPRFMTDNHDLKLRMQAFVVETPDRLIVVDTCYGNDKQRPGDTNMLATPFLERFGQAGYDPEKVDTVLCTHLHVDHVGWNTRLVGGKWVPTFPNARYLIARVEHENWSPADREMVGDYYTDSIQPIFDAGLVDLVETDHRVAPEVSLIPTPGHTVGHVSIAIASQGEEALITGDFIHHPAQLARPEWSAFIDHDGDRARETRLAVWEKLAGSDALLCGSHFMPPVAGRISKDGRGYKLIA